MELILAWRCQGTGVRETLLEQPVVTAGRAPSRARNPRRVGVAVGASGRQHGPQATHRDWHTGTRELRGPYPRQCYGSRTSPGGGAVEDVVRRGLGCRSQVE